MRQAQLGALTILAITCAERAFFASEGTAADAKRPQQRRVHRLVMPFVVCVPGTGHEVS